jgi:hypothetical protein
MREAAEERLDHDQAGGRLAAPSGRRTDRSEAALLVVAVLVLVHLLDHVLRADVSGWPFTPDPTWFTVSLLLCPTLLAGLLLLRGRPWVRVALAVLLLVAVQVPHVLWEAPADQYGTWAHGMSWMPASLWQPNLLGVSSPALGCSRSRWPCCCR